MRHRVIFYFLGIIFSLHIFISNAFAASDWQKMSDKQIARLIFNKEKLYFQLTMEGLLDESYSVDGVVVHNIKRLMANFDDDFENEMAVSIVYSTGMCTSCAGNVVFAILDRQNKKIKIQWTNEGLAFDDVYEDKQIKSASNISTIKLIKKDNFFELLCIYNSVSVETGGSYKQIRIIRWNGTKFAEIWHHEIQSSDTGGRGGIPHSYISKFDFIDDNTEYKKIKVAATYTYFVQSYKPHLKDKHYSFEEEFIWSEKEQRYLSTIKHKIEPLPELKISKLAELPFNIKAFIVKDIEGEIIMVGEKYDKDSNFEYFLHVMSADFEKSAVKHQQSFPLWMDDKNSSSHIIAFAIRDIDGDGEEEILLVRDSWGKNWGFEISLYVIKIDVQTATIRSQQSFTLWKGDKNSCCKPRLETIMTGDVFNIKKNDLIFATEKSIYFYTFDGKNLSFKYTFSIPSDERLRFLNIGKICHNEKNKLILGGIKSLKFYTWDGKSFIKDLEIPLQNPLQNLEVIESRNYMISSDFDSYSPEVIKIDCKGMDNFTENRFLLDDIALLDGDIRFFDVYENKMAGIVFRGTRIINPNMDNLNEKGLFVYFWDRERYVLKKKFSLPEKIQKKYDVENFALLMKGIPQIDSPFGIFSLYEGVQSRGLYVLK